MPENKIWSLEMSEFAKNTDNPLRKIWESPNNIPNPEIKLITLQIGKSLACKILFKILN